jgi:uncharacterized protein (TIGR00369 family)
MLLSNTSHCEVIRSPTGSAYRYACTPKGTPAPMSDAETTTPDAVLDTSTTAPRTRTITWKDPDPTAAAARHLGGLEFLRTMIAGELPPPPIAETLGFRLSEVDQGRAVFHAVPAEYQYNPIGVVHGGVAATLLDSAMTCAIQTMLPAGVGCTTLEIKVNYLRPITRDTGELRCEAKVLHLGGRTGTAEGKLVDQAGKLYAHGTTTCIILRP